MKKSIYLIGLGLLFMVTSAFAANSVVVIPMDSESAGGTDTTTVLFSGDSNVNNTKRYAGIAGSGSSTADSNTYPMTRSGTIKNFTLYIHANDINASASVQIAVEKNGVTTVISDTYDFYATGLKTIPGTVSFNAGDRIAVFALDIGVSTFDIEYTGAFDIEY